MSDSYRKRWLEAWLVETAQDEPVVVVTGPRQVGKSTLIRHCLTDDGWRYLSFDDFETLSQAQRDPAPLLADPAPLVIDEVQKEPRILPAIKRIVDRDRRSRRFVLSGSSNLLLMNKVGESLAGRAVYGSLGPFTLGELQSVSRSSLLEDFLEGKPISKEMSAPSFSASDILQRVWEGWMPVVVLEKKGATAARWLEGYVTSYLERDLRQLSQIDSLVDFRRLMTALALRSGSLLNQTEIGRDIGMSQPTVNRYVNLLEVSQLLYRLPAFAINRTKRLMKTPKPYFFDSGLAAFLSGETFPRGEPNRFVGALLETAVFHHLRVWCQLQTPSPQLSFWRTTTGQEVDFVIEKGRRFLALEVKSTTDPRWSHAESIREFLSEYPETVGGIIVHLGCETLQLDEKIFAVPFERLI
jgi:predicted AAA+ superfamily ATPase